MADACATPEMDRADDAGPVTQMPLSSYGFIIKAPGYDPATHQATLESAAFRTRVVCVSTDSQAREEALRMIEAGVQVIELCGGFTGEEAASLTEAVQGRVPVGHVHFAPPERALLTALLEGRL